MRIRYTLSAVLALALITPAAHAQQKPDTTGFHVERSMVESLVGTLVKVIQEAAFGHEHDDIGEQLRGMARQLNAAASPTGLALDNAHAIQPSSAVPLRADDLEELAALLVDVHRQLQDLRSSLVGEQSPELADRLGPIEDQLAEAVVLVSRIQVDREHNESLATDYGDEPWLRPGHYDEQGFEPLPEDDDGRHDEWSWSEADDWRAFGEQRKREREERRRIGSFVDYTDAAAFVGEYPSNWPYAETSLYYTIPAIRYNRVEGLVLGVGSRPLQWDDYERSRLVGQVGYAFALDAWRYEVGLETRVLRGITDDFGLKVGGSYLRNTATEDLWKSNWVENTLAALLFRNDFFDYYEVQGWNLYAVQRFTPYLQVSTAYHSVEHSDLTRNATWSLFGGERFRENPPVTEGTVHALLFAAEGGRVFDLNYLPRGAAFRVEAEIADGLGGDLSYNRYIADGRVYLPTTTFSSLSFRLRGGLATGDVPLQKAFALGGVGSLPAYPQNALWGTRMLLGNVEYAVAGPHVFDDVFEDMIVFGFADAGWVGGYGADAFDFDDVYPEVGLGVALDERNLRLELSWPLRDYGGGMAPTLWFRLSPTF